MTGFGTDPGRPVPGAKGIILDEYGNVEAGEGMRVSMTRDFLLIEVEDEAMSFHSEIPVMALLAAMAQIGREQES